MIRIWAKENRKNELLSEIEACKKFIELLPEGFPMPEFWDDSGYIGLVWHKYTADNVCHFYVSFVTKKYDEKIYVRYCFKINESENSNFELFTNQIPEYLQKLLGVLCAVNS